ncbi:MAG: type II toxin-antitoxin system RelE/ParE family toxin [Saprospirales bacterium]|nr:MAG: type II toxin-antitoxin system RelE/ParE family toxin [Saprospirales bacterium]
MGLEVYWLELAESKLEDIYSFYSIKANQKIASDLVSGIVERTLGIVNQPKIGAIEQNLLHRDKEFRFIIFKNYKIVYWINYGRNRIEIANIFDTRQDPEKLNETSTH